MWKYEHSLARFGKLEDQEIIRQRWARLMMSGAVGPKVPPWYIDIMSTYNLVGRLLDVNTSYAKDGSPRVVDEAFEILTPESCIEYAAHYYPASEVSRSGLVPFAECCLGGADPCFIDFRCETENPEVIQLFHDVPMDLDNFQDCGQSFGLLAQFFEHAVICR